MHSAQEDPFVCFLFVLPFFLKKKKKKKKNLMKLILKAKEQTSVWRLPSLQKEN